MHHKLHTLFLNIDILTQDTPDCATFLLQGTKNKRKENFEFYPQI